MHLSVNAHNKLLDLSLPRVMAIVNVTTDSFYTSWGEISENALLANVEKQLEHGADIIDIGACSTRPGSVAVSSEEEWKRLKVALQSIRAHFSSAIISVDTFRSEIAERAILLGADIINDVYGGMQDTRMWDVVASYKVPYVLTFSQDLSLDGNIDCAMGRVVDFFQAKLDLLHRKGVVDVIIDPGFGFGKTEAQNYRILCGLDVLSVFHAPLLVGISRKSMLYKPLGLSSSEVLPATISANTMALERGARILRVHDVQAAKQAIAVYSRIYEHKIN